MRSGAMAARSAAHDCPGGERGFTLLEILVAVAILAALVAIVPRSFVSARTAIDRSEHWLEARLVAEAVLNGDLADRNLRPGIRRGNLDGHRWAAVIVPSRIVAGSPEEMDRILLDVRLAVSVSGAATLDVETMRVGFAR
jgi:prepilin-type N-terminal cleavage/methylation domain-containing protein